MPAELPDNGPPELWGGVECTVNRVGDRFFDQLERSGHARRATDLDLFAALGVRALRYPVLWERTAPAGLESADWSWPDARLARLRELNLRPVVGLLHHGSGPRHTSLVDPLFPEGLAGYARAVAERYPWVEDYTPVNEPLTTARFSGLYGHWYPHGRDDRTFLRALLNQCRAVALSMRAVREVNPRARLVQTEDLGKTHSTRALLYQADFENERRWLSFDLLAGRLTREHPLWYYARCSGVAEGELEWFAENPTTPDVLGINHYITSERFLDERLARYPARTHGGNGRQAYADVEAVRVLSEGTAGPRALLAEAWGRYGLPLAVTEAHLGCTREEQLRWLAEMWGAASSLRREGVDVRAVTAWSLLGAYDWDSLLACDRGRYEPGVFDLRGGAPRPTALARLLRELAAGREPSHPVLDAPGWWRRLDRLLYPPARSARRKKEAARERRAMRGREDSRPVLITGATGTLGRAFARLCRARAIPYRLLTRDEMDIADAGSVADALDGWRPWAVVNAAGYVRVDDAEREPEKCFRENAEGAAVLAAACASLDVALLTFSSDLVFDGAKGGPYVESDGPSPLNVYGRSKAEAESRALAAHPAALVVRTSAFFGPWDEYNFVTAALRALSAGERFAAESDSVVSPTYVPDLANACLDLLIDGERGLWHLSNGGAVSWAELARLAARLHGLDETLIDARPTRSLNLAAPRPAYSALSSVRGALLPPLADALARYTCERETPQAQAALSQAPPRQALPAHPSSSRRS
ncbi:MAG TPA: family 1 glycosylhydrolase [Pyrinomonadaceae bacterium]|nr:family 1 glycosylhydrolase [Pyrinomonadaceae bacterium]